MSHSAPSESSAIDAVFIVGTDLVEFDRRDLPIYLTPETRWAEACNEAASYGAPLDRLFGEPGDVHIDGVGDGRCESLTASFGEDPLVGLSGLSDGDGLIASPSTEHAAALEAATSAPPEIAAIYDFGADHVVVDLNDQIHDGWNWQAAGVEWTFQPA